MKHSILCWCVFSLGVMYGQKFAFEEASIKAAEAQPMGQLRIGMTADAGLMRYSNVSLKDCVRVAYRVKDFQVEGPDWMATTRFDITAKLPAGSTRDQIPEMLQALLQERFKLVFHRDKKEHAIEALVAGKGGPKLKAADVPAGDGATPPANHGGGLPRGAMSIMVDGAGAHLKAPATTLTNLADMMSRFTERPVIDMTGIEGQYEFDLVFSPENMRGGGMLPPQPPQHDGSAAAGEAAGTIADSVRSYGLKLESRKAPMDVLIVDHMEKTPTEN